MSKLKLTQEELLHIFDEDTVVTQEGVTLVIVERGEFEQDGKYQSAELIFTDGDKYYSSEVVRSGSPFTEWDYDDYGDASISEVQKVSVVVERWVAV